MRPVRGYQNPLRYQALDVLRELRLPLPNQRRSISIMLAFG